MRKVNPEKRTISTDSEKKELQLNQVQLDMSVYPNPAEFALNITWPEIKSVDLRIELLNLSGSVLRSFSVPNLQRLTLDISDFVQGFYIVAKPIHPDLHLKPASPFPRLLPLRLLRPN